MKPRALFHSGSLLGREVRERVAERPAFVGRDIHLFSALDAEVGTLTEVAGAATFVRRYTPGDLEGVELAIFCDASATSREIAASRPSGTTAIFLGDAAGDQNESPISPLPPIVAGINDALASRGGIWSSPHPAAVLLAHLLHPLRGLGIEEAVATVIQPASIEGEAGVDELFEDARQVFTMSGKRKNPIFGKQLAFNLLPTQSGTQPIAQALAAILQGEPPVALHVIQGGVFHGITVSLFVRSAAVAGLAAGAGAKAIKKALAANPHLELDDVPKGLGPIDAAGTDKVLVAPIRAEANAAGGFWIWATLDNLARGGALNALEIAEGLL